MVDLTAIKPFTYANRRLLPDDDFVARTTGDARALVALGKARPALTRQASPQHRPSIAAASPDTEPRAALKSKRGKKGKAAS